jgi:hypothetical protein
MTTEFNKSATTDFPLGTGCWGELYEKQLNSAISGKTSAVIKSGDNVNITCDIGLTAPEILTQDSITNVHTAVIPWQTGLLTNVTSVGDSIFSAYNSVGGQTIVGAWVSIIWDTQDRIDSDYSNTLGTADITINSDGDYEIQSDITIYLPSGSSRTLSEIRFVLNGVFMSGTKALLYHRLVGQGGNTGTVKIIRTLSSGDVINIQAIRKSGGGGTTTYPEGCRITIKRLNN